MAERLKATVLKTVIPFTVSGVRIPPAPLDWVFSSVLQFVIPILSDVVRCFPIAIGKVCGKTVLSVPVAIAFCVCRLGCEKSGSFAIASFSCPAKTCVYFVIVNSIVECLIMLCAVLG